MREWDDCIISIKRRFWWSKKRYKEFGRKSVIDRPYMVHGKKNIIVGKGVMIRKDARIEVFETWGGNKFEPELVIENDVSIEQNLHLTCAGRMKIGEHTTINANVLITDINHNDNDKSKDILEQGITVKSVQIGKNCFIGKNVCILGARIGDGCIVGANAVVTRDVPPYSVVAGVPAKIVRMR